MFPDRKPAELDDAEVAARTKAYLNVMRGPGYRQDLDLVAVSDSGEFAAFCLCWLDSENRVGYFEPVGCHPDFRRKGLTRAVILEGLRRFRSNGAEFALVDCSEANVPARRLYESCGFRTLITDDEYARELPAA